jgi:hypothetical protein
MAFLTDSADHVTGKTGLTLTITASKAGGGFASITPTVTERGNGWYALALTSTHTDTLGDLALHITGTGADPADILFDVSPVASLAVTAAGGVTLADGVAHGGTPGSSTATLALKQINCTNSSGAAMYLESANDIAAQFVGDAGGLLLYCSGSYGSGLDANGKGGAPAFYAHNIGGEVGQSPAVSITSQRGPGVLVDSGGHGVRVVAGQLRMGNVEAAAGTPVIIDSADHGLTPGDLVTITGVGGCTAANGTWRVSETTSGSFTLHGSAANAPYTSGGAWLAPRSGLVLASLLGDGGVGLLSIGASIWAPDGDGFRIETAAIGKHDVNLAGSGDVWDGVNGRPVQVLSDRVMFSGALGDQSGAAGPLNVVLPSVPAGANVLLGSRLRITSGTGQCQERTIVYSDGTDTVGLDWPWSVPAVSGDSFQVLYDNSHQMTADGATVYATVSGLDDAALARFFTTDSGSTYADAVAGSVVKETANSALYTAMTESYATDGAAATLSQMFYMLWSALCQADVTGTTISCKKLDGTTQSMTFTLDDATLPTSRIRSG